MICDVPKGQPAKALNVVIRKKLHCEVWFCDGDCPAYSLVGEGDSMMNDFVNEGDTLIHGGEFVKDV
ncbi:hypothetical protein K9N08_04315 [Candidatus Gracilibacteria bacterium]|nr:hypothetical protein [Candidatus Gracilibacteria bacterium]MCF7856737.1 hypothetical protein [Candidatus Gracilibacteria bacterium]MCF7896945.1 hypothetical protein [Candidatus Gracilibacteria bacterium]